MTDIEKIVTAAILSFLLGLLSGVLLEKYREHKRSYDSVLDGYLKSLSDDSNLNHDEWRRFAAAQRAGIWRLSGRELKKFEEDVVGRGFKSPFSLWRQHVGGMPGFPKTFLRWAKEENVDFSAESKSAHAVMRKYGISGIVPPNRIGATLI